MSKMEDVDHTHPHTDEPFGDAFRRGPDVAADGGRDEQSRRRQTSSDGSRDSGIESRNARDATDQTAEQSTDDERMEDVDHEAPNEGANRTFERGTEGRDESV